MSTLITFLVYGVVFTWVIVSAYLRSLGADRQAAVQSDWVLAARFIYVLANAVIFVGLTSIVLFGGDYGDQIVNRILGNSRQLRGLDQAFSGNITATAPFVSATAMYLSLKLDPVRDLDRRALAWLHSTEHLQDEIENVRLALLQRDFEPSPEEVQSYRRQLRKYNVRITDTKILDGDITLVTLWRKISCLLRLSHHWRLATPDILDKDEISELRDIELAEDRKTRHALDIIRAIRLSETGSEQAGEPKPGNGNRPLQLGSAELGDEIVKIQHYFVDEYEIILDRLAALSAKLIVKSGDRAEQRWIDLKTRGFQGLGEICRLGIDNIVKLFLAAVVIVTCVALFFVPALDDNGPGVTTMLKMGLAFGFAMISGAIVGSNRSLARRDTTPWAAFAGAGLMSFLLYLFVFFGAAMMLAFREAILMAASGQQDVQLQLVFGFLGDRELRFKDIFPWIFPPTAISVAICWASRRTGKPFLPRMSPKVCDGLLLFSVLFAVTACTLALHLNLDTASADLIRSKGEHRFYFMGAVTLFASTLGFLIGYVVVDDIRRIAHSRV